MTRPRHITRTTTLQSCFYQTVSVFDPEAEPSLHFMSLFSTGRLFHVDQVVLIPRSSCKWKTSVGTEPAPTYICCRCSRQITWDKNKERYHRAEEDGTEVQCSTTENLRVIRTRNLPELSLKHTMQLSVSEMLHWHFQINLLKARAALLVQRLLSAVGFSPGCQQTGSVIVHKQRDRFKQAGFICRSEQRSRSAGSVRTNWPPPNPCRLPAAGRGAGLSLEIPPELEITSCWLTLSHWRWRRRVFLQPKQRKTVGSCRETEALMLRVTEQETDVLSETQDDYYLDTELLFHSCLFVGLSAGLKKNYRTDFYET